MDFEIFDRETRQKLERAGVDLPSSPSTDDADWADTVLESLPLVGSEPADADSVTAAFGHWAEDGDRGRGTQSASGPAPAHPPIDVRGWTTDEIRDYYAGQMDEDWTNGATHNEHMNQDLEDRLAYEATGVHDTWQTTKHAGLAIMGGLGAGAMAGGIGSIAPRAAWLLGMSQASNENEAAFAAMFYPFRGGGSWPRGQGAVSNGARSQTGGVGTRTRGTSSRQGGTNRSAGTVGDEANAARSANRGSTSTQSRTSTQTQTEARATDVARSGDKWSRAPRSIQDKMALEAAKGGEGKVIIKSLSDPRYKGMQKMEYKVKSANGRDSVVHYVRDPKTGKLMDFKFKKHSGDAPKPWGNDPSVPPGGF